MKRWLLYHILTILDVLRLWSSVQHHVVIVAGICLPILLLLGLKNGHVADLREELLRSPTGRQIVFWAGQQGELMTSASSDAFDERIPGVEIVIPEIQRLVSLSARGDDGTSRRLESVTLYSTRPGDPILSQYGVKSNDEEMTGVILMGHVAAALGVARGDDVTVAIERARDGVTETASVSLPVGAIIDSSDAEDSAVGYASVDTLAAMEQYVMGFQVRKYGWPAFRASAPDLYSSYLIFCEKSGPLSEEDLRTFRERGYTVKAVQNPVLRSLHGLLKPDSLEELLVYQLREGDQEQQSLSLAPGQVARLTEADDVVVAWNEPANVTISGGQYQIVGLSIPQRTWLRLYLRHRECGFDFDADSFSIQLLDEAKASEHVELTTLKNTKVELIAHFFPVTDSVSPAGLAASDEAKPKLENESDHQPDELDPRNTSEAGKPFDEKENTPASNTIESGGDSQIGSDASTLPEPNQSKPKSNSADTPAETSRIDDKDGKGQGSDSRENSPALSPTEATIAADDLSTKRMVAVVPMDLLAHLRAEVAGHVEFDPRNKLFVAMPRETLFDKARLYADTIDDVPVVAERLRDEGFAIMSEVTRIREIHQQDHSLQLLVLIVGAGVFIFGTMTVVSVLLDSTERKRGTIGILRVMGVSRIGVFYMVFFRSAIIGILAACVTIGLGFAAAATLEWKPPGDAEWASWKPAIHVIIQPIDIVVVVLGAITCCTLGSVLPANKASRMDPFDAIIEGRFR